MKIKTFKVERWMNEFEDDAVYNLGETCIDSLTVGELLSLCGEDPDTFLKGLKNTRLTYSHIFGSPQYLEGVAGLYEALKPENVVPTHGAIGANNQVITTLIEAKDNMVCVMPTYQQHYSIPESIGAEVRILQLRPENNFLPDIEELKSLVDENTKMITLNNPDNPTGSWIPKAEMEAMIEIARSVMRISSVTRFTGGFPKTEAICTPLSIFMKKASQSAACRKSFLWPDCVWAGSRLAIWM